MADSRLQSGGQVAYQSLANDLRRAISRGEFADGKRLPTEVELSASYQLSRQTVRRALQDLVADGLVFRVRGRGTYTTPMSSEGQYLRSVGSIEDLMALSVDTTMEVIHPLQRRADISAASRLNLPSDQVMVTTLRRFHEQLPFCVSQVFLPLDIGRRVLEAGAFPPPRERASTTVINTVDDVGPERIIGAHQSVTACPMPSEFAALIDCEAGDAVLRIDRVFVDTKGRSIELGISYFNPARYSYRLELRRSPNSSS